MSSHRYSFLPPRNAARLTGSIKLSDDNIDIIANAASNQGGTTSNAYYDFSRTSEDGPCNQTRADHHPAREENITHHLSGRDVTRPIVTTRLSMRSSCYVDSGLGFEHDLRLMETLRLAYVPLRRSLLCAMNEEVGM